MAMSATLELPQLSGGRKRAVALLDAANVPASLRGLRVEVDCRQLRAGTESFADELVRTILVDRGADQLVVTNVVGTFASYVKSAGETHAVSDRLSVLLATDANSDGSRDSL
jgi:hypothetical protein